MFSLANSRGPRGLDPIRIAPWAVLAITELAGSVCPAQDQSARSGRPAPFHSSEAVDSTEQSNSEPVLRTDPAPHAFGSSGGPASWLATVQLPSVPGNQGAAQLPRLPLRVAGVLLLLGAAAAASLAWLRPAALLAGGAKSRSGVQPRVLASLKITPHCGLHLVQMDRHRVIVGVDRSGIRELSVIQDSFSELLAEDGVERPAAPAAGGRNMRYVDFSRKES